jgi:hypothetical protein
VVGKILCFFGFHSEARRLWGRFWYPAPPGFFEIWETVCTRPDCDWSPTWQR